MSGHITISEFSRLSLDHGNQAVQAPAVPAKREQRLEITAGSQVSEPFPSATRFIMVHATEACCLAFGPSTKDKPLTADPRYHEMGGGETRYYGVGEGDCIAVIMAI